MPSIPPKIFPAVHQIEPAGKSVHLAARCNAIIPDQRPINAGLLDKEFVCYSMAQRTILNPRHEKKAGIYGCAGSDWSNFILATDAREAYFIDLIPVDQQRLIQLLENEWENLSQNRTHIQMKQKRAYGFVIAPDGMDSFEQMILLELKSMGVAKYQSNGQQNIMIETDPEQNVRISFKWAYSGQLLKPYSLTFIAADVRDPANYPSSLKRIILKGIDIYYQRAGVLVSSDYQTFLPVMVGGLKIKGFIAVEDLHGLLAVMVQNLKLTKPEELRTEEITYWAKTLSAKLRTVYGWQLEITQKKF